MTHRIPAHRRSVTRGLVVTLVVFALAGCTTTVTGTGSRVPGGASPTDFPSTDSPTTTADPPSPTDSPTSDGGDAADLVSEMADDMAAVASGFAVGGDFDETDVAALDLQMQGSTGQGSITLGGETCQIRAVEGTGWANASAAFWTDDVDLEPDVAAGIAGRWVELTDDIEFLLAFVDQEAFVDTVIPSGDDYTLGDSTTRDGVDAVEVESNDATLVIATDSPHPLLAIVDDTGTAEFTFPDDDLVVDEPSPTIPFPS